MAQVPARAVTLTITQVDVDHGVQGDCRSCPIAQAASRDLFGGNATVVTDAGVIAADVEMSGYYTGDRRARRFIADFDRGVNRKPTTVGVRWTPYARTLRMLDQPETVCAD